MALVRNLVRRALGGLAVEILLDDETLDAIEESDRSRTYVSREDVFGDVL